MRVLTAAGVLRSHRRDDDQLLGANARGVAAG